MELAQKEEQKQSFWDLLNLLEQIDECVVQLSPEEISRVLEKSQLKVDTYKYVLDKLKSHAEYLGQRAAEFAAAMQATENHVKRLKAHLVWVLEQKGTDRWPGKDYQIKLVATQSIQPQIEPNSRLSLKFPDCVKRSYSWDKKALKEALQDPESPLQDYAKVQTNKSIRFSVRREKAQ